jgi:hypothetical protein
MPPGDIGSEFVPAGKLCEKSREVEEVEELDELEEVEEAEEVEKWKRGGGPVPGSPFRHV